ncbi:beta-ketoacyl synthase N-terminal-like domain-containing protein [Amycolatopsis sp. cmx-4-83]|uniref:beta-ketoacyl synthase N-terminal-like domain-containing protein n=1 Tax=Amycolatopsis sp. cmx-4-83 TaxID=2790940 RepID=UPI00397AA704
MNAAGIRAWLLARLGDVDADRPLQELGLSSRDATVLAADLGRFVGRPLAPTLVWQYPTIAALAAHLSTVETAPVPEPRREAGEPIAIVGLGCRLPGGLESPAAFWRFLDGGGDAIGDVPEGRWETFAPAEDLAGLPARGGFLDDVAGFDAAFFGITPREAEAMDPQQRILLEVAWAALEHAGIPPERLRGSRTGVFVGLSATEYGSLTMTDVAGVDVWSGTGAAASIAANRLSYLLDLRGPSLTLDTACSSSLVAVHQAVESLRRGESELALAAGVNVLLSPGITAGFHRAGVLAADGRCKPFDASADGIVRGEGCGVVVLKPLRAARRDGDRVLALVRGSAVNSDGRSNGLTAPNPEAQAALLRDAYAGIDPSTVDYVEAHGTGTPLGDPLEAGALTAVLGRGADRPLLLGSVKSNLGHLEGAAGIAGLLKVVLAMTYRRLPASLHFSTPNPYIDFSGLRVVTEGTSWPRYSGTARAGVSAFGFGGTNAHVVLEEWPAAAFPPRGESAGPQVFALSARSDGVVRARAGELADWLAASDVPLGAVAATLAHRREHLPARGAVVGESRGEVVEALRELAAGRGVVGEAEHEPSVVFVFSGYGSQWCGMGRLLLGAEPAFRAEVDALDPVFRAEAGFSLREALSRDLPDLAATQLTLFGVQLALAALWRAHGVTPAAVLGHSMGEVAAAVVAGALDVGDGLLVMATRARLLTELDESGEGAMAVVELSPAELADFPEVAIAVYASATQCTVSGPADQVEALVEHAESLGRLARRLPVGGAGHSAAVDAVLGRLRADLAGLVPCPATIPCYSSVLDDPRETPAFDVEYWAANLRRPVRFSQALAAAAGDGHTVFVEIAPHPVALAAIEQAGVLGLASGSRRADERTAFLTSLARLHVLGLPGVLAARPAAAPVELPGPVWRHERFWPRRPVRAGGGHPLLGVHIEHPDGGHLWRADVGTEVLPWLADHTVRDRPVFPATGFLELALAAGRHVLDLELREVLPLAGHTEVTTTLTGGELSVHARSASGEWVRHATARIGTGGTPSPPLGAVEGEPVDVYRALAELGQSYGPAFRGLRRVVASGGRASASIALPEADHPAYVLHPALADACLHALAAAVGSADGLYLPLSIGEVVVAGEPRRGVRVDAVVAPSGDGLLGSVQLVDAEDVILVEFRDVYCRRLRDAAVGRLLLEAAWQPVELPEAPSREHHWIELDTAGLGDRAALAKLLRDGETTAVIARLGSAGGPDPEAAARLVETLTGVVAELAELPAPPRLWLVTAGAQAVRPGEAGDPGPAAVRGLMRVLAFEHPELRASLVDCDDFARLRDEIHADAPDDEIAWRDGVRYARRLSRPELGDPIREPVREGAYIITGGLGGLGLVAAKWLAERGATRVVLSSRRAVDPAELGFGSQRAEGGSAANLADSGATERTAGAPGVGGRAADSHAEPGMAGQGADGFAEAAAAGRPADGLAEVGLAGRAAGGLAGAGRQVTGELAGAGAGGQVAGGLAEPGMAEQGAGGSAEAAAAGEGVDGCAEAGVGGQVAGGLAEAGVGGQVVGGFAEAAAGGQAAGGFAEVAAAGEVAGGLAEAGVGGQVTGDQAENAQSRAYPGVEVRVVPGDIAEPGIAEELVAVAVEGGVPLRGVLHAAGVLGDGAAITLDGPTIEAVWRPKALGAWRLHQATAEHDLDWWLVYSSAAALFGSPGQAAYASANAWADALVAWRRARGLPAATINWGAWGEVGAAAGSVNPVLTPLGTEEALAALDAVLARDRRETGVARIDAETVLEMFPRLGERPFFEIFTPRRESTWDGVEALRAATPEQARAAIGDHLAGLIAGLLGFAEVDRDVPLTRLGLDSLSAMRARGAVERDFGLPLPIPLLLRGASLAELAGHLAEQAGFGTAAPVERVVAGPRDPAERWVARHWRTVVGGAEPGVHDDFFAAGGDPERLRALFAAELDVLPERLFDTPTVAAMADLVRDELEGHGGGPVRVLRDGAGDPVFLFHPAGGRASVYRELVRLLPEGQPVYGFERIDDEDTVEAKAACYAELVREIQPDGPYRLGGWSFGGCLAYETARQLGGAELVFLIDTILPLPAPGTPVQELLLDRFDRFADHVSRTYGVPFSVPREELTRLDEDAQIRWVMAKLAELVPDLGAGVLRHQYESYVDARVAERYFPEPCGGRVVLLRAQEPHPLTTALDPRYLRTDDTLGWDAYCGALEVVRVPGDHVSMIDPPHVTALAAALAARLGTVVR